MKMRPSAKAVGFSAAEDIQLGEDAAQVWLQCSRHRTRPASPHIPEACLQSLPIRIFHTPIERAPPRRV